MKRKTGYLNKVVEPPDIPTPDNLWEFIWVSARVGIERLMWRISGYIARVKKKLFDIGLINKFTLNDAKKISPEQPQKIWELGNEYIDTLEKEILPWLHETVMRAPLPWGIDEQVIGIRIFKGYKLLCQHARVVDKYGWRKEGKDELTAWLRDSLSSIDVEGIKLIAQVYGTGLIISEYKLMPKL
jgi:hypothetical protein